MDTDNRMKQRGYTFLSFPVSWLEDRPIAKLPHEALGVYVRLYFLAGRFNKGGALQDEHGPLDVSDIAYLLRCNQGELEKAMQLLESHGLLTNGDAWHVLAFEDEQIDLNERREEWRKAKANQRAASNQKKKPESELEKEQELKKKVEEEVEEENTLRLLPESSRTPPTTTTFDNPAPSPGNSIFFKDVYRTAKERGYKASTEDIQAAISAYYDFVDYHNEWSGDIWSLNNIGWALEALDKDRWFERLLRDLKDRTNNVQNRTQYENIVADFRERFAAQLTQEG